MLTNFWLNSVNLLSYMNRVNMHTCQGHFTARGSFYNVCSLPHSLHSSYFFILAPSQSYLLMVSPSFISCILSIVPDTRTGKPKQRDKWRAGLTELGIGIEMDKENKRKNDSLVVYVLYLGAIKLTQNIYMSPLQNSMELYLAKMLF